MKNEAGTNLVVRLTPEESDFSNAQYNRDRYWTNYFAWWNSGTLSWKVQRDFDAWASVYA